MSAPRCTFVGRDGIRCPGDVEGEGELCFWHDPAASKEGPDIKARLQEWARQGRSMEGFVLRYANLEGVRLSYRDEINLSYANLFRANLRRASMWKINLKGSSLLKADLSGANLNEACLEDTDLLAAVLDGTKLERVVWGEMAPQERQALHSEAEGRHSESRVHYEEAEEVYRSLRLAYDNAGVFDFSGRFFYKEMTMRRKLMPRWSSQRLWSKLVDLVCAYGESPPRVIGFSLSMIALCALLYALHGVKGPDGLLRLSPTAGIQQNLFVYLECLYFSIVTFTTLGYGDITPDGLAEPLAAVEAFIGAFMMALFVAVFGRKMTR